MEQIKLHKTKVFTFRSKFGSIVKIRAKATLKSGQRVTPGEWWLTAKQAWKVYLMLNVTPEDGQWELVDDAYFRVNACTPSGERPINGRIIENGLPASKEAFDMWTTLMRKLQRELEAKGTPWDSLTIEEREAFKRDFEDKEYLQWYLQKKKELQDARRKLC